MGALQDDRTLHNVLKGLHDEKWKTELLQVGDINMAKLTTTCAKYDSVESTLDEFGRGDVEVSAATAAVKQWCSRCGTVGHTF